MGDPRPRSVWRRSVHRPISAPMNAMLLLGRALTPLAFAAADRPVQRAQYMLFAGFILLGWVLARRTIRGRRKNREANRAADRELRRVRESKSPAVPLADAPVDTLRWQAGLMDLQRELTAEMDTRIAVVQSLIDQVDERSGAPIRLTPPALPPSGESLRDLIAERLAAGHDAAAIADEAGLPEAEIRWTMKTLERIAATTGS